MNGGDIIIEFIVYCIDITLVIHNVNTLIKSIKDLIMTIKK